MDKIILASQSPRRKQLLELAEIDFEVHVADIDETHLLKFQVQSWQNILPAKRRK